MVRRVRKFVLDIDLSSQGIRESINRVREVEEWVSAKTDELMARLANIGWQDANINFMSVAPFYNNGNEMNATITVERVSERHYVIRASGEDVCFIEFGAGVTYGSGYPGVLPDGVVGIGQYGKGQGANPRGWNYPSGNGWKHTYGNPPAAGMFSAAQTIQQQVYQIAQEVFS